MKEIINYITSVNILGMLPIYFAIIILLASITIRIKGQDKLNPIDYIKPKKKYYKSQKLYETISIENIFYYWITIILVSIPILAIFNKYFHVYIYEMIGKVEFFATIAMGLTAIVITAAVVIVSFDRIHYLIFSTQEVLNAHHFSGTIGTILISCILVCTVSLSMLNSKIETYFDIFRFMLIEFALITNFIAISYAFYVIYKIMFSNKNNELKMSDYLYQVFWLYNIDDAQFVDGNQWTNSTIKINTEYLFGKYLKYSKSIKIENALDMGFVTTLEVESDKWYNKSKKRYWFYFFCTCFFSCIINYIYLKEKSHGINVINIAVTFICIVLPLLQIKSLKLAILKLFSDTWGYYLKYGKKDIFIPRVGLHKKTKYDKYIWSMNSLIAFYYIANIKKVNQDDLNIGIEKLIEWLDEEHEKSASQYGIALFYLPLFIIGLLSFGNIKYNKLILTFNKLNLSEEEKIKYKVVLNSIMIYLQRNILISKEYNYQNYVSECGYWNWLNGKPI